MTEEQVEKRRKLIKQLGDKLDRLNKVSMGSKTAPVPDYWYTMGRYDALQSTIDGNEQAG